MEKQFITEARRLQKLAGILEEGIAQETSNIEEVNQTDHYKERKEDRSQIVDIQVSPEALVPYTRERIIPNLKDLIQKRLLMTLRDYETSTAKQAGSIVKTLPILTPYLQNNGTIYPIYLVTKTRDKDKENVGNTFVLVKIGDSLVTVMVVPRDADLMVQTKKHLEKKVAEDKADPKVLTYPIDIGRTMNSDYIIDIKQAADDVQFGLEKATVSQEELPYKVRTDYRKDAVLTHDTYGNGKIVNTSAGTKGDPGISGKLEWVDVDFGKPFLKAGKLTSIRRINNVYTTRYFATKAQD
jgi:hypothetical protein